MVVGRMPEPAAVGSHGGVPGKAGATVRDDDDVFAGTAVAVVGVPNAVDGGTVLVDTAVVVLVADRLERPAASWADPVHAAVTPAMRIAVTHRDTAGRSEVLLR